MKGGVSHKAFKAWPLMSVSAGQKRCEHGKQASTKFGQNLSMKKCPACFLGIPAGFGGPGVQGVAPGEQ
eukprot:1136716-Pelagomonas_calceolata.AAC.2